MDFPAPPRPNMQHLNYPEILKHLEYRETLKGEIFGQRDDLIPVLDRRRFEDGGKSRCHVDAGSAHEVVLVGKPIQQKG